MVALGLQLLDLPLRLQALLQESALPRPIPLFRLAKATAVVLDVLLEAYRSTPQDPTLSFLPLSPAL